MSGRWHAKHDRSRIRRKLGLADVGWVIQRPIEPTTVQPASMARTGPDVPAPDPGRIRRGPSPGWFLDLDAASPGSNRTPRRPTSRRTAGGSSINSMGCRSSTAQSNGSDWRRHGCGVDDGGSRRYGVTALSTSTIEEAASHRLGDRTGIGIGDLVGDAVPHATTDQGPCWFGGRVGAGTCVARGTALNAALLR